MPKMDRSALLKKIAESSASGGGNNLRDGRGRLVVKKLSLDDGFKGARFVTEAVVIASSKIPVTELKTGKTLDITPNEVGSDLSIVHMLDKHESAFGNVKGFVLELFGEQDDSTNTTEFYDTLKELTEENAAHGMVIDYSTYRKITSVNKVEIVLAKWSRVEQTPADIKRMREWLVSLTLAQQAANAAGSTAAPLQ